MIRKLVQPLLRRVSIRGNVSIGPRFHVGPGSVIWAPRRLRVGSDVYVGKNVTIEVDGEIGDGVLIANAVGIVGKTDHDIGHIGSAVRRSRWVGRYPELLSHPTVIGSDVWIGYGAIILSGTKIGDSSVVAAGSVVTKDVPPNTIVAGNPARVIRQRFSSEELITHWTHLGRQGVSRTVAELDLH